MEDIQLAPTLGMEPSRVRYFDDEVHAFFWNRAVYAAVRLGMLDCRFALTTQVPVGNVDGLAKEVKKLARAMDNYAVYQMCGWYSICDTQFNKLCSRMMLRDLLENELRTRNELLGAMRDDSTMMAECLDAWTKSIDTLFRADFDVLGPVERHLPADLAARILACAGNDWEFLVTFALNKFEEHGRVNAIAALALDFQTVLKKCTIVENDRIRNVFFASLSAAMRKRVLQVGFDMTEPASGGGFGGVDEPVVEREGSFFRRQGTSLLSHSSSKADLLPALHRRQTSEGLRSPPAEPNRDMGTSFSRQNSSVSPFLIGLSLGSADGHTNKRLATPGLPRQKSKASGSRAGTDPSVVAAAAAVKTELDVASALSVV
ncbi:hypothetical protein FVE85_2640 [Porphyridium purpureum]|uniref:Uncharacterized protein n=1 Tax=Porphyridium purpureum TaxID=35688 RepID=A0A5J4YSM4_PORPP|nr:hypothetical protein FVE85_2640 [Porphyridium purpureum]|eukprot:POR4187..scf227_4